MAASFSFSVRVIGPTGVVVDVELPVTLEGVSPVIVGSVGIERKFTVDNPTDSQVTMPSITAETSGPNASKIIVALLFTAMTIPAGGSLGNSLIITPSEPLIEGDVIDIAVKGVEG